MKLQYNINLTRMDDIQCVCVFCVILGSIKPKIEQKKMIKYNIINHLRAKERRSRSYQSNCYTFSVFWYYV